MKLIHLRVVPCEQVIQGTITSPWLHVTIIGREIAK